VEAIPGRNCRDYLHQFDPGFSITENRERRTENWSIGYP